MAGALRHEQTFIKVFSQNDIHDIFIEMIYIQFHYLIKFSMIANKIAPEIVEPHHDQLDL